MWAFREITRLGLIITRLFPSTASFFSFVENQRGKIQQTPMFWLISDQTPSINLFKKSPYRILWRNKYFAVDCAATAMTEVRDQNVVYKYNRINDDVRLSKYAQSWSKDKLQFTVWKASKGNTIASFRFGKNANLATRPLCNSACWICFSGFWSASSTLWYLSISHDLLLLYLWRRCHWSFLCTVEVTNSLKGIHSYSFLLYSRWHLQCLLRRSLSLTLCWAHQGCQISSNPWFISSCTKWMTQNTTQDPGNTLQRERNPDGI